jgi:hypothetical protein
MPRFNPNIRKRNNRSSKAKNKKQDSKGDAPTQSDSCSGTDTDSACYSLESSGYLSSSSSSKPILLQPTIDYEEGSSKPKSTNPFKTNGKAEVTKKNITAPKETRKSEASKAEASTQAATEPKTDSNAEPSTKEATKTTTAPKTDSKGEASMKTTIEDTTTPKRNSKTGATTQAIIVPMAVSKIEAATQAIIVPEAGNETKVATQAATDSKAIQATTVPMAVSKIEANTQATTTPKTDSETEDIAEDNTISNAFSKIEADLHAENFRAPRHRNTWARPRPRHRLKGFAELEKEKEEAAKVDTEEAAKESTSQVLPVKVQDNDSTNGDKEVAPTESQDNGVIDEDKKTVLFQSNDATNEDDNTASYQGDDATNDTSDNGEKSHIDLSTNLSSENKEPLGPSNNQSASEESTIEDKEENATPQSENHVSDALRPESTLPRTSQSSESSYHTAPTTSESSYHTTLNANELFYHASLNTSESSYHTAVTDGDNEASTLARVATPDLIPFFPIIPPRSSSTSNLILTDASHNPIGTPKQPSSSSLKVMYSNNTSTTEDSLTSDELQETTSTAFDQTNTAEGDTDHINAPPLRRQGVTDPPEETGDSNTEEEYNIKYLHDIPALDNVRFCHIPDVSEIVKSSSQYVVVYNSLSKERRVLMENKKEFQKDLDGYRDIIAHIQRAFMAARNKLDALNEERKSHTGMAPHDWTKKQSFYRDRLYLYGKRSLSIAQNAVAIGDRIDEINVTAINIDEELHILQNTFRNRTPPKKKVGCISCFKKIGRIFKSKKSKN